MTPRPLTSSPPSPRSPVPPPPPIPPPPGTRRRPRSWSTSPASRTTIWSRNPWTLPRSSPANRW
ncbi:hypothetical protein DDE74_10115 [Streptomyces lydicus]|uniref:Uncharacterized protein n=1 Tax=Streptomyces lydicus TaxID=47763 RepID=A0A3Q9K8I3_9ACTN|nr:hypothetical protein DDE74_10115 [Streptomyces lydicus]